MLEGVCGHQLEALMRLGSGGIATCATAPRRHARLAFYGSPLSSFTLARLSRPNAMLLYVRAISWNVTAQRPFTLQSPTYTKPTG